MSEKQSCEDCNKAYYYEDGQIASDGTFYCNKCLDSYLKLHKEQDLEYCCNCDEVLGEDYLPIENEYGRIKRYCDDNCYLEYLNDLKGIN